MSEKRRLLRTGGSMGRGLRSLLVTIFLGFLLSCSNATPPPQTGYTATRYPIVLVHGLLGFDDLFGAMVAGYRQHRELDGEQLDKLTLFLFLRGLTYLGWVHTRKETATAIEITPMLVEAVPQLAQAYLEER